MEVLRVNSDTSSGSDPTCSKAHYPRRHLTSALRLKASSTGMEVLLHATGSLRPSAALPGDDRTQAAAVGRSESPISYSVSSTHTNPYSQHTPIVKIYQIPHELCPSPGMPAISLHSSGRIWRRSTKSSQEHPPTELVLGHQTPNLLVSKKKEMKSFAPSPPRGSPETSHPLRASSKKKRTRSETGCPEAEVHSVGHAFYLLLP